MDDQPTMDDIAARGAAAGCAGDPPGGPLAAAVAALHPFFDPGLSWSGAHLEHFAYRALRELRPELTVAQTYVLVIAAKRLYSVRRRDSGR